MITHSTPILTTDVSEYVTSIVLGLRFRSNFSIEDHLGTIMDHILYDPDTAFGPGLFPTTRTSINEKILLNEATGNSLRLNPQNAVLEYNLSEGQSIVDLDDLVEAFYKQVIAGLLKDHGVTQIQRVGIIHRYHFDIAAFTKNLLAHSAGRTLEGVNDLAIRFSKRYPMEEALTKKNVNDYRNVIFNIIKEADKDGLLISLDYQWYFDPPLAKPSDFSFHKFRESSRKYNSQVFPDWINRNYGELQS